MYDYVIVTHLPAFYKVNLYNQLSKKLNIFVIFIAAESSQRTGDFVDYNCDFDYKILNHGSFETRNKLKSIFLLFQLLSTLEFNKVIVSGWDLIEFWLIILSHAKNKNCLALESTVFESNTDGIKGLIKKIFLSRISTVFASGDLHVQLLKKLGFKNQICITKGVGIINKPPFETIERVYKKKFIFLGRLSPEKNLHSLIQIFNDLPEYTLTLIGKGPQEYELKRIAKENIIFIDHIENKKLTEAFRNNDVLILPSISEPWGLVTEEALYFGIPVIISQNCGSSELIRNGDNGFIVNPDDVKSIKETILKIDDELYKKLLSGVNSMSIDAKDSIQIGTY